MKNKKTFLWILALITITVFIYGFVNNPPARYSGRSSGDTMTAQPSSSIATITQTEWRGVTAGLNKRIEAEILTPGVTWLVRLDKDDNCIHPIYPTGGHVEVGTHTNQQWMIKPGQAVREALVRWKITDPK